MLSIHALVGAFDGPPQFSITHLGPGSDEAGFVLSFGFSGVFPESRVHEAFAAHLRSAQIEWIIPRRHASEIDLDAAKRTFPSVLKAAWIRGKVQVEPEIDARKHEGAIGLGPETNIVLRLIREEVAVKQQNRIFLSHKRKNKAMVTRFYEVLKDLGFDPWIDDEDMTAGDNLHRRLDEGMSTSCAAVFFITPDFTDEAWLAHEIELAMREQTKRGDAFRIITLSMRDERGNRGIVPSLLQTKLFKEPTSEINAVREILRGLPIRVGPVEAGSLRARLEPSLASAPRPGPTVDDVSSLATYQPLLVVDRKFYLEWRVVDDPADWIDAAAFHGEDDRIEGPFHCDPACRARLNTTHSQHPQEWRVDPKCPRCKKLLFSGGPLAEWRAKHDVVEELRRSHRRAKLITDGMELEHLNYWDTIRPAKP